MKALHTKKFVDQKSISGAAIPVQSQIKSRPFVVNSAPQSQELTQKPKEAKKQGFNFAQIPIFPGMRPAVPEMLQPKQAKETLKDLPEVNLAPTGGGKPMPEMVQQKFETSFGTNLSDIRIHEGPQAEKIGAIAYAQGKNIHIQPGKYQPTTQSGQEILGHEVAHTLQQEAGRVPAPQSKGVSINADPKLETEADVMGAKAARGESAQVSGAASSGVQRMPAQDNVVQCVRDGKQRADQPSGEEKDDSAYLADRAAIDAVLEEYYTDILDKEIPQASTEELNKITNENNSFLSPVARQRLMLSEGQEQAGSSTDAQEISQNSGNRQYIPEDLFDEDKQEGSSGQSNSQEVQQEEDNRPLPEIFANIKKLIETELPPEQELNNLAVMSEREQMQGSSTRRRVRQERQRPSRGIRPQQPPIPATPRQEAQRLLLMDYTAREQAIRNLQQDGQQPFVDLVIEELGQLDRQAEQPQRPPTRRRVREEPQRPSRGIRPQQPPIPATPQQEAQRLLLMDNTAREQAIINLQQDRQQPFVDLVIEELRELYRQAEQQAEQEAQRLLLMDYTAREQAIRNLQQGRQQPFVDLVIEELRELDRQQDVIRGLEGRIPLQAPQTPQLEPTTGQKITKRIRKVIGKSFDGISYITRFGPDKEWKREAAKEVAGGPKQTETNLDQWKILGQDSTNTNIDQIGLQNLPANAQDPLSFIGPLPNDAPKAFSHDAAVAGMVRDDFKAFGGLALFADNLRAFKQAYKDKTKPRRERIAILSNSTGEMTSALTYTVIVGTQAQRGIQHLAEGGATSGSGAIAAVEKGGKIGTLSSAQQGGFIVGTSLPFDIGKVASGVLTTLPKLIIYTDAAMKAAQKENYGGYKSWGRGVKNFADLTKSAAGAVKDAASLANNAGAAGGAQGAQIIAGGAVAPAAAAFVGGAEAFQGARKFKKAYKNKKGLNEIANSPTLDETQIDTLNQLKEIQKKKMKRAAIQTTLGTVTLGAGVAGFTGGPAGLVAATAMGVSVGAFQLGQWGTRKLKQKMRDKEVRGFDLNKTTHRKNMARTQLTRNTLDILEGGITNEEKETIFSSMGLNGNKKDSAVQEVYNDVLAAYLEPEELQHPTNTVNRILKLKGHKSNLKQEVSWNQLSGNDFPADFASLVKKAAINKGLKKR
ncbi:DUF4157 domain-containing protein [Nostoc sp. NMS4]|uniref:eCIS core domain-containing protein n=1 Tax=Nostoc sp. NMS4 TaxID=2815390 RepID=UPI0025E9DBC7|nr:DUF4157 domain-containing protein [Nostoc sp. NMS4]MBN3923929.1 DUF4157 domain-containing protein [Nostoc sp. NMS4]